MTDKAREIVDNVTKEFEKCHALVIDRHIIKAFNAVIQSQSARIAELEAQRDWLLLEIDRIGEIGDICTRRITKKICSYCECVHKTKQENTK